MPLAYLQRLPGGRRGASQAGNTRSIGSPLIGKGRLRAFLKDLLLQELEGFPP